jgi:hypothetical protein
MGKCEERWILKKNKREISCATWGEYETCSG